MQVMARVPRFPTVSKGRGQCPSNAPSFRRTCGAFKHRPVPIDQVFCTRCMLCLLQSWRFELTGLPKQTMQRTQNTYSRLPLSCVLSNMNAFALAQMQRCVQKPFVQRNSMTSSTKVIFEFLKIAESFRILVFCIISSAESQSKAQHAKLGRK